MPDIPPAAIAAAESAIRDAFPGEFGKPGMPEPDALARAALEAAAPLLAEAWGADEGATMAVEWGIRQNITPGHLWSYGFDEQRARKERPLIYGGGTLVRRTVTYGEWEEAP